ncbi:hypothetical protein LUI11_38065 [Bradyrhizobium diazoefficiens]|uniref:Bsl5486 protein n=1 Tax=Bradyrhizobium diazoefficiens (strain JCM 10833 / BCRC 13528 / IAM 13628 / NBRC 14792 / USDA 110) TaxID=224911 RepID=Q89IZ8_BRADU|nr:hypothetical protein [Bradyrhizobium diazoefficiens]AND90663.1 hypothetical protein AAV28_24870 [Bradyrhizobium diazoefficiens USDA 110]APO52397.1 hypothetical protein BD122_19050 [Bradyrhizobium diazoefficiens]KOY08375.1 hypothetical protein AF336_17625 [Bradyrhizobium diazoefficiens]MCD9297830.1 hypothetical protein [Bradyrhizobium diazoefficiens]MCD9810627.1 hypothetical protein [Bradyrhizobium diazoefficiens]
MKLLMISGLAVFAVFVAATNMLRSHPLPVSRTSVAGMPVQEMQRQAQQGKLPVEDFVDRSLVFPRGTQE